MVMASSSATRPTDLESPILVLTDILLDARDGEGLISVPSVVTNTIKSRLRSAERLPAPEIQSVVSTLDSNPPTLCSRLNVDTFVIITAVLRASEPCMAQERGLYLLTRSLEEDSHSLDKGAVAARKAAIGEKVLSNLLRYFGHAYNPVGVRRWIGLLAGELLQDCEENENLVDVGPEDIRRALGQTVTGDNSQILRIVAGTMIRGMTSSGIPGGSFWPIGADERIFADFPKSQHHTSQWVVDFEEYLDGIFSQGYLDEPSASLFAHGMRIGKLKFSAHDQPAILVTVTENLCIMVPSSDTGPAIYVDIPLQNVTDIGIDKPGDGTQGTISQKPPTAALRLHLSEQSGHTFYLNASQNSSLEIVLFLNNAEDATDLGNWIQEARATPRVSRSQTMAVSQQSIDSLEAIASAAELHAMSARGDIAALGQKHSSPPFSDAIAAVGEPTSPRQEDLLNSTSQASKDNPEHTRTSLASVGITLGISNQQAGGQSRGSLSHIQRSIQQSSAPAAFARQFDEFSDQGLTSSAQWMKGLKVINNAPELQVEVSESLEMDTRLEVNGNAFMSDIASSEKQTQPAAAVERTPSNGSKASHYRAGALDHGDSEKAVEARAYADNDDMDHDSLYDASPKGSGTEKAHAKRIELMLDGSADKTREKRDYPKASSTLGRMNAHRNDSSDLGVKLNTTAQPGSKIVHRMRNVNGEIVAPADRAPGAVKSKSVAPKKPGTRAKIKTARAVPRSEPDVAHEDDSLFNVPESPHRSKKTGSTSDKASKGQKATKRNAKPAVYSAKVAMRASVVSTAKPQAKGIVRLPEPRKVQKAGETDWDEGLNVDEEEDGPAALRNKGKFTLSKSASSAKGEKTKNIGIRKSPIIVKARSSKKKKIANPKTVVAKRQSSPVALNQPKSRRAAAVKANNRIQGIHDENLRSSAEPLQPKTATDKSPRERYGDSEAESAELRLNEGPDLLMASPSIRNPPRQLVYNGTPVKDWTAGEFDVEAPGVGVIASPNVHQREPTGSPDGVALVEQYNKDLPVRTMESGQLSKQAASADVDSCEKENRKAAINGEDFEQPINNYFNDAMAFSDEDMSHKSGSLGKAVPVQKAGLSDEAHNEEPPAGQERGAHDEEFQSDPKGAPVKTRETIASKLNKALSGLLNTLQIDGPAETKVGLPRASAKFQPRMTETTPIEEPQKSTEVKRTKLGKPLHAENDNKKENIYSRVDKTNKQTPGYTLLENLSRRMTPQPAQTVRNSGPSRAGLSISKSNADHTKSEQSEIINISSEDGEVSEYVSDGSFEDGVPELTARDISTLFPPTLAVVAAKPKHVTAEKTTAAPKSATVPKIAAGPKIAAVPKVAAAQVAPGAKKRKLSDQEDEARVARKRRAPLPTKLTTPPEEAGTEMAREGTPQPLTDDHLHRKSALISFSARGPRNQGIVSTQKARVSTMGSKDREKQGSHQKEVVMKRKRNEDTVAAARLMETPEEKRCRRSLARGATGATGLNMLRVSRRLSSQSTRVDENGSPRALVKNSCKSDAWAYGVLKRLQALEESAIAPQQNIDIKVDRTEAGHFTAEEMDLPTLSTGLLSDQDEEKIFPSIRKQLPSSPNAPSQILADFTAHRVQPGGKFVNVKTESIVKPSVPQDPFTGNVHRRHSSFMERLRAQSKLAEKSGSNDTDGREPTRRVETAPTLAADPMYSFSPSLGPDLSTPSSESPSPSSHMPSTGQRVEDDAVSQWRQALKPYQSSQLDVLYDISNHLVRHLIDQETAVGDIIENYQRKGTRLIEDMEKTHRREYQEFEGKVKEASSDLAQLYTGTERKWVKRLEEARRSPVAKLEKEWKAEQEEFQAKLDAAFQACRD